jgi:hypothetical protein
MAEDIKPGDLVVPSVSYEIFMYSQPTNISLDESMIWNEDVATVVDVHDQQGMNFIKLITSRGQVGWVYRAFVRHAK